MTPDLLNYVRTLSIEDRKTLSQKCLKAMEELGAVAKLALQYENAPTSQHEFVESERILEKAVDATLCTLSIAYTLGLSDQDISDTMYIKAEKWHTRQAKERGVTYPLPYEVHITVSIAESEVELFRTVCGQLNVKPIIIDLEYHDGTLALRDVMTSSKHFGDNRSAYIYARDLARSLAVAGFTITRTKIETVPWHPLAPVNDEKMPQNCYFEAHIPVRVMPDQIEGLRRRVTVIDDQYLHISRNKFKQHHDGSSVIMLTLRHDFGTFETFKDRLDVLVQKELHAYADSIGRVHTEFSVYDTKISHDNAWFLNAPK